VRQFIAALASAAVVLFVAACGSSSSSSSSVTSSNAADTVAKAASASAGAAGYKMTLSMKISSPALSAPITATGSGSFSIPDHAGSFNLAMDFSNEPQVAQVLGSSTFNIEEIIKAPIVYVKLPGALASKIPGGKPWLKIDLDKAAAAAGIPGLSSLTGNPASSDPSQLLQYLRAVSGTITKVGTEQVGGTQTTHYKATISLDKVPNAVPAAQRKGAQQAIASLENLTHLHSLPVDVWIDDHNLVRQMQMSFASSSGGQNVNTQMTIGIPEYGAEQPPKVPPDSQVTDASAFLSAAAAAGAGSTTTTP
jgi:Zn-dependent alcohol dehydrogenase